MMTARCQKKSLLVTGSLLVAQMQSLIKMGEPWNLLLAHYLIKQCFLCCLLSRALMLGRWCFEWSMMRACLLKSSYRGS